MDDPTTEIALIGDLYDRLREFDPATQRRIVAWLSERIESDAEDAR